ncbi:hypothetical protein EV424DRAFT_328551 [Suillus variegatus]|nr:hypothetical protein EV424DRAFT_328551 [Suillus variegatus]
MRPGPFLFSRQGAIRKSAYAYMYATYCQSDRTFGYGYCYILQLRRCMLSCKFGLVYLTYPCLNFWTMSCVMSLLSSSSSFHCSCHPDSLLCTSDVNTGFVLQNFLVVVNLLITLPWVLIL